MEKNSTCQKVKTTYRLYEDESHKLLTNKVTFIFIELPKFKKSLKELDGNILEGMYFCFKHISRLKEKPRVLDHQIFTKIFETTEFYNMDEETRNKVLAKMTTERDLRNQMRYARNEAIEEGRAEGRAKGLAQGLAEGRAEGLAQGKAEGLAQGLAEGRAEAKAEAIRKMLKAKLPIEQVAAIMEMSVEEIHNLE